MNTWTPEAETLKAVGTSGTMTGIGGAKCIVHVTVSPSGGNMFDAMHRVLTSKQAEPHYLYDPVTDRLGQYFPLDRSSRSLRTGAGPVSCNKNGTRVIQIEVVADVVPVFTSYWNPGPNFRAMMRDIEANGVPATFPLRLATSYADSANVRLTDYDAYRNIAGFIGHCNVPGQNVSGESPKLGHFDPGAINPAAFLAAGDVGGFLMALSDAEQNELLANSRAILSQEAGRYSYYAGKFNAIVAMLAKVPVDGSVTAEAIAAAIPADIAQQVVDALASRLNVTPTT